MPAKDSVSQQTFPQNRAEYFPQYGRVGCSFGLDILVLVRPRCILSKGQAAACPEKRKHKNIHDNWQAIFGRLRATAIPKFLRQESKAGTAWLASP